MDHRLLDHVRVSVISLQRNELRWNNAADHMRNVFLKDWAQKVIIRGDDDLLFKDDDETGYDRETRVLTSQQESFTMEFVMAPGVDAHRMKQGVVDGSKSLQDVEAWLKCKVYQGWAIRDEWDVAEVDPATAIRVWERNGRGLVTPNNSKEVARACATEHGLELFMEYESWFSKWNKRHRMKYVEYFNRHVTLGEVGSSLAHLRLIERQVKDEIPIQVIFEDDARPRRDCLRILMKEIQILREIGQEWDVLLLHSVKYDMEHELESPSPKCCVRFAKHRKITDAYCVSLAGARKISASGYRESIFAFDDFLPSLFSQHPRPDVMRLPCVMNTPRLVALTFPDELQLSSVGQEAAVSDNNLSPCLIGDHGPC